MAVIRSQNTGFCGQNTPIFMGKDETLDVVSCRRFLANLRVPWTALLPSVSQAFQIIMYCRHSARCLIPHASIFMEKYKEFKIATFNRGDARTRVRRAAVI